MSGHDEKPKVAGASDAPMPSGATLSRNASRAASGEAASVPAGMNRRQAIKTLALGGLGVGVVVKGCAPGGSDASHEAGHAAAHQHTRLPGKITDPLRAAPGEEALRGWKRAFFDEHEYETIRRLATLIMPADERSGSAEQANVAAFIDFSMTESVSDQTLMRGGLRWLDLACRKDYGDVFIELSPADQTAMLDRLAWPDRVAPGDEPGERFFNLVRNYTSTGFWSSKTGMADIGYIGNVPYYWEGPPASELRRLGLEES